MSDKIEVEFAELDGLLPQDAHRQFVSFTLPRALQGDRKLATSETQRLVDAIQGVWDQLEWEREVPVHVCDQEHGQEGYRHPAICLQGCKIEGLEGSTEELASANAGKAVKLHQAKGHEVMVSATVDGPLWIAIPTCHDCGRNLQRPKGMRDTTWVCPLVAEHGAAQHLADGQTLECGSPR
jgi:hypothetical protein